jgi:predicted metalloprotease
MKWRRGTSTGDVIDARGAGGGRRGGAALPVGGGLGVLGVILFLAIQVLGGGSGAAFDVPPGFDDATQAPNAQPIPPGQDPDADLKDFSTYVFNNVQGMWQRTFEAQGATYRRAKLYLYTGGVDTHGCGSASSAVGPFYCPADGRVYLDLSFYRDMERQLQAGGDFAWAYVIAHELGHHIQNLQGTSDQVQQLSRSEPSRANEMSVRLELQADCYAGVWARSVMDDLEAGDLEEAFTATEAVGDDRLQRQAGQQVNADTFTHGSSAQRRAWFDRGRARGEPADCDTFSADRV